MDFNASIYIAVNKSFCQKHRLNVAKWMARMQLLKWCFSLFTLISELNVPGLCVKSQKEMHN